MQIGIHLPHAGEQATPALIRRAAERAEDLGLEDVWVSEHIIVPRAKFPRSPLFYDPVLSPDLGRRRHQAGEAGHHRAGVADAPSAAARQGTRDVAEFLRGAADPGCRRRLARGRVRRSRACRSRNAAGGLDEGIAMMRAVWTQDPVTFQSSISRLRSTGMTMPPYADAADPAVVRRQRGGGVRSATVRIGDGWHGSELTPDEAAPIVARLRREARRGAEFTISIRYPLERQGRGRTARAPRRLCRG